MWLFEFIVFLLVITSPIIYLGWKLWKYSQPEVDQSLKDKSEAYAKWMKTKSDEDYQKYLELKEAREIEKKNKKS